MTQYHALHPATFKLDGGAMFGIIPKPLWEKQIPADELNRIHLSLRVLCIQTEARVILIDTGIGDYHDPKFSMRFAIQGEPAPLIQVLKKELDLNPEDVTDLVVTHLHFDHVGGLGQKVESKQEFLFPKAKLHLHRSHYNYALKPTPRDTGSFQAEYFRPVIEQLESEKRIIWHDGETGRLLIDNDYELNFKCSHGHTPWLMHPFDSNLIYMADLVPTSAHVPVPWVMGYDISPGRTTFDKQEFYQFIIDNNLTMIFEHDMKFWGAKLKTEGPIDIIEKKFESKANLSEAISFS